MTTLLRNGHTRKVSSVLPEIPLDHIAHALLKGLGKSKPAPLPAGKHHVRGEATVTIDAWLTKGAPVDSRQPVPGKSILAVALEHSGLTPEQIQSLIQAAAVEVLADKAQETPLVDAALERVEALMPSVEKEGACFFAGSVEISGFEQRA